MSSRNARDWEKQFNALKEYKDLHGDCDVPVKSAEFKSLGRWVSAQVSTDEVGLINEKTTELTMFKCCTPSERSTDSTLMKVLTTSQAMISYRDLNG